jgi:Type IV secretion system pilin
MSIKTHKVKKLTTRMIGLLACLLLVGLVVMPVPIASAACNSSGCDLVATYVNPFINMLTVAFGIIAVISIILGGIQYSTSEGDPQKASKAKNRLANTVLAILAYSVMYGFLQFLVPGSFFSK